MSGNCGKPQPRDVGSSVKSTLLRDDNYFESSSSGVESGGSLSVRVSQPRNIRKGMQLTLRNLVSPFAVVVTLVIGVAIVAAMNSFSSLFSSRSVVTNQTQLVVTPVESTDPITPRMMEQIKIRHSMTGCWSGMGGGRLQITENKIYDLGSEENAPIRWLQPRPRDG